jgi:uncharacterized damage-inducible protein DinB
MTQKAARDLVLALEATPAERLNWQPEGVARSIFEQLTECIGANYKWSRILSEGAYRDATASEWAADTAGVTPENLGERLIASAEALAATLRGLDDSFIATEVSLPWKPEVTRAWAEACFHAYWNMCYHEGQIAYIQTLYGDTREHADSGPFGE